MGVNISGVVVAYNPTSKVIENMRSYLDELGSLFFIDNSPHPYFLEELKSSEFFDKIVYFNDGRNRGISEAINMAAENSVKGGFSWLLTMDQDSNFETLRPLINYLNADQDKEDVGIYSPFHDTGFRKLPDVDVSYPMSVMTSGNLVNLDIFKNLGGLDEKLFIDRVDHDYCLTLIENGFKIKQVNNCRLVHGLGDIKKLVRGHEITNHSPLRRYYITRNTFYFIEKHFMKNKKYCLQYAKSFVKDTILSLVYEDKKLSKLKFIMLGFTHYLCRKGGPLKK